MPVYYLPVPLPERCLLSEALYWIAFQRLPAYETDEDGADVRQSRNFGEYELLAGDPFFSPDECERANIPHDPRFQASI